MGANKGSLRLVSRGVSCLRGSKPRGKERRRPRRARCAGIKKKKKRARRRRRNRTAGLLLWRIDDASKINVNTTKLVPAAFARGNGISVFTNSIDDISSVFLFFSLSLSPSLLFLLCPSPILSSLFMIDKISGETRRTKIIGFRGLNYFSISSRPKERNARARERIRRTQDVLQFIATDWCFDSGEGRDPLLRGTFSPRVSIQINPNLCLGKENMYERIYNCYKLKYNNWGHLRLINQPINRG